MKAILRSEPIYHGLCRLCATPPLPPGLTYMMLSAFVLPKIASVDFFTSLDMPCASRDSVLRAIKSSEAALSFSIASTVDVC